MQETRIKSEKVSFQAEGRLLQELGERLVASPEVALLELIKNAYDADSPDCNVSLEEEGEALVVRDRGLGMNEGDFKGKWMRIATASKLLNRTSAKYHRNLTGQKGIGRFAVRFLGHRLELNTIAWDADLKKTTRLVADFDWLKVDKESDISGYEVSFRLSEVPQETPTGTTLKIRKLRTDSGFLNSSEFHTSVLKIVSPLSGLDAGRFSRAAQELENSDPGFQVGLPSENQEAPQTDLAEMVLNHAWARLEIDVDDSGVSYKVSFAESKRREELKFSLVNKLSKGLHADIRFFPRRKGIFGGIKEVEFDGRAAWQWVRSNQGVAIVDHGFRIKPYGFGDDDWLKLDRDNAHSERDWQTKIAEEYFPMTKTEKEDPAENPMLNLPSNFQLVGAVFVESSTVPGSSGADDLLPSMDREGFLENEAYSNLFVIVRAGLEFLALKDKRRLQHLEDLKAREAAEQTREDLREAIEHIKASNTLTKTDKGRLVIEYGKLAKNLVEVEEYDKEARRKLETMSLLGVVAGYMTHEASRILESLDDAVKKLKSLAKSNPSIRESVEELEKSYEVFSGYVDYTKTFISSTQSKFESSFKAKPQINRVIKHFSDFAIEKGIDVKLEASEQTSVPPMPIAVYSGVLLNLFTNALKALLAGKTQAPKPTILIRAWNDEDTHVVEVHDTGIGIPPSLRIRIWDPGFTTTSQLNNPLGTGMGLGLTLIRELVTKMGGKVALIDPAEGFNTCFRVTFKEKR